MDSDGCVEHLTSLGSTMLEAEIYVYLVQHSPASGYKIAKAIGRSFPSTYKAVVSLQAKGAVLVDGPGRARDPGSQRHLGERAFGSPLQSSG